MCPTWLERRSNRSTRTRKVSSFKSKNPKINLCTRRGLRTIGRCPRRTSSCWRRRKTCRNRPYFPPRNKKKKLSPIPMIQTLTSNPKRPTLRRKHKINDLPPNSSHPPTSLSPRMNNYSTTSTTSLWTQAKEDKTLKKPNTPNKRNNCWRRK